MPVGNYLGRGVPLPVLAGAEVGLREDFLEAQDLHTLVSGFLDVGQVSFYHDVADLVRWHGGVGFETHLDQAAFQF
jgi:hypothetical protein